MSFFSSPISILSPWPWLGPIRVSAVSESEIADFGMPVLREVRARLQRRGMVRGCPAGMMSSEEE
jgi:hypothetical protein